MPAPDATARVPVLFLSSAERPGADTFIHMLLMRELDRRRYDVHVAYAAGPADDRTVSHAELSAILDLHLRPTSFGPAHLSRSRHRLRTVIASALPTIASLVGLALYVRRNRIRVLHSTDRLRDAVPCVLLGRLTGARSVVHNHLTYGRWMSPAVRWSLAHADARVSISEFVARSFIESGSPPERTYVVLNAIDVPAWRAAVSPETVRGELGIAPSAPVVTCIARIFPGKGQADLIRAIAIVAAELPDVRLVVTGSDDRTATPGGGSYTSQLRELAAQLGIAENVIFTGFRTDAPAVLAASDVFAMASFEEPFGLVYLEAMATRLPVVGLNNGGTVEVVEHGRSGLLSPPGDPGSLAASLLTLLRDPELRRRMGEYGRRQVETRFTPQRMARDTERAYADLLNP